MEYRQLGHTDIKVSVIGLGTMTYGQQNTEKEAHEQLDYSLSQGVNFIDTAELYPTPVLEGVMPGTTESFIGSWLKNQQRDKIVVASKVCGPGMGGALDQLRTDIRLSQSQIIAAADDSLRRLQTDYMDLYQIHWPSRQSNYFGRGEYTYDDDAYEEDIAEAVDALEALVAAGKTRAVGISNETPWGVHRYLSLAQSKGFAPIVSVQNPYGLLNRIYEFGLSEFAHRSNVGLLAYSPLGFGVLSGKYLDGKMPEGARLTRWGNYFGRYSGQASTAAVREYVQLAQEKGLSPAHLSLAFVTGQPFVTSNLIGATSMEQLKENIASADVKLDKDTLEAIGRIHSLYPNPAP
ncbi:MAG: aldo/keto reductase [Gammaproteobacteria bacterium]|nr:aldo/keto reductase [Pseudomonadota bacterium]MCH9664000.1 aldo/keto reductase [Gammaproteobacteria bacterium]